MLEACPFCAMPINREYGSFRCKNCARSSEDLLDLERKKRASEARKAARAAQTAKSTADAKRQALAMAVARHIARKRSGDDLVAAGVEPMFAGAGAGPSKRSKRG